MNAEQRLLRWLRDAHAMELQAETLLERQAARLEHYPKLQGKLEEHLQQTRRQAKRVEECIKRRGEGTSVLKDTAARITGMGQALSGLAFGDEVMKNGLASYTFEHFEVGAYRILAEAARTVGDTQTAQVCEEIQQEEQAMADWLKENLGEVTQVYLRREQADMPASH